MLSFTVGCASERLLGLVGCAMWRAGALPLAFRFAVLTGELPLLCREWRQPEFSAQEFVEHLNRWSREFTKFGEEVFLD